MTEKITILQPDDWHLHLRDQEFMRSVVADSALVFGRAIIMPNLAKPVFTTEDALAYRERILNALPEGVTFDPLMTLYLTGNTTSEEVRRAKDSGLVYAIKLYPAGATTNSSAGVEGLDACFPVFETMQEIGMPLSIHGEVTTETVDVFDREQVFIDTVLVDLVKRFPNLKIILEHVTTKEGVQFVENAGKNIAATITPHHIRYNRNKILGQGINPYFYCLPVLKSEEDRKEVLRAATSGNPKFFLGTDSAPHPVEAKERQVGAGGIYSANFALPFYAEAFDSVGKINMLEDFASKFGPQFYGLPVNTKTVTLEKTSQEIPDTIAYGDTQLRPMGACGCVSWTVLS